MSFLAPWFVAAGLAAIGLPVLFHLFRRTPRGRMPFSTLMFLTPSPPRLTRRSHLENWPLLLLRAAVFLLLALAFGRPFLRQMMEQSQNVPIGGRTVILLDRSASMRRGDLWQQALKQVDKILDKATPYDDIALATFAKETKTLVPLDVWRAAPVSERAGLVRAALLGLEPTWSGTNLDEALTTAAEMLDATDQDKSAPQTERAKRVVVVSDLQAGSRLVGLQNYEWPRRIQVDLARITMTSKLTNAGLHPLNTSDETTQANSISARPRVLVTNATNSARESFEIFWNDKTPPVTASEPNTNAAPDNRPIQVYVPPGQSRVVRTPPVPAGDVAELVLRGDDETFDNHLWFVPPAREQLKVLHLSNDKADDPQSLRFFLERAFAGSTAGRLVTVETVDPLGAEIRVPNERDLENVQLIILAVDREIPTAWHDSLKAWMTSGGIVVAVLGKADSVAWRGLLPTELAAPDRLMLTDASIDNKYALLSEIDLRHPIFQPFADPRYSDFTKIHFWRHRRLTIDEAAAKTLRVVARFDEGDPALVEISQGLGRLFLFTSGWQPRESQLGVSSKFVPLMLMMVELGRRHPPSAASYDAGETVDLRRLGESAKQENVKAESPKKEADKNEADKGEAEKATEPTSPAESTAPAEVASIAARNVGPWKIKLPDGTERTVPADSPQLELADPGIYEVRSAHGLQRLSVNVTADESKTAPLGDESLETLGVQLVKENEAKTPESAEEKKMLQSRELEARQQLWRWCLMVGLGVIVGETWFAGYVARKESVS